MVKQGKWSEIFIKLRRHLYPIISLLTRIYEPVLDMVKHKRWQQRQLLGKMPLDPQTLPFSIKRQEESSIGLKNIVWIVLDALRQDIFYEHLRRGGLEIFEDDWAYFSRAFSQGSWTYPSIFSFLTARYPFNCGVSQIQNLDGNLLSSCSDFDESCPTLFDILRKHEYNVGSVLDGWGFTVRSTAGLENVEDQYFEDNWGWIYGQGRRFMSLEEQRDAMRAFIINAKPHKPFFLFARSLFTHSPYREIFTDGEYVTQMCQRNWRFHLIEGFIRGLQRFEKKCLEPLLGTLAEIDQINNTIIILCSDHGEMLWDLEQDLRSSVVNEEAWRHELEPYNALIKVPLFIWGTNLRGVNSQRFRLMDVVPTLLDELGLEYDPAQFDGVSIHNSSPRILYADSAGHGNGGISYQSGRNKILMSKRLGMVSYKIYEDEYERLELRSNGTPFSREVMGFLEKTTRNNGFITDGAEDALLRRLRSLGYIE
jgi:membrane-anchored protein YejM (alkaline phosphatase superfamily)